MKLALLYGTETGNSEMLCEDIEIELGDTWDCALTNLSDADPHALEVEAFHIFVTSTYGNGDLPTTAVAFYDRLVEQKPDLSGLRFAIFGLGDMVFEATFAHGSERLLEQLLACGATQVGTRGIHDASTTLPPEDIAMPWVHEILGLVQAQAA